MTVESTIDYEGLAQEAMRGVVRKVLANTAKSGLAGDHHFYISFDTEAPGVSLSKRLKEKYPREMTIVLQHRFWDLAVSDERFEVKLTFDGIPERLVVPFDAIKVFFDPSVRFGLQFEDPAAAADGRAQPGTSFESLTRNPSTRTRKATRGRKSQTEEGADKSPPSAGPAPEAESASDGSQTPTPLATRSSKRSAASEEAAPSSNDAEAPLKPGGAEIVSLDKFRKK